MKFKIRFADQIVGVFVVVSLVSLIAVLILLGSNQRWFARDVVYHTILPSAGGLSRNMAVQFKGFTIGSVRSFHLTDRDYVEVIFIIHEEHSDRVRHGSIVELLTSPVGLGSQFLFHSGRGAALEEGSFIPAAGSPQARELIRQGLAAEIHHDDSISILLNRVNSVIGNLDEALGHGTDETEIGMIVGSLRITLTGVETLPQTIEDTIADLMTKLEPTLETVNNVLGGLIVSITEILENINEPGGLLSMVLDSEDDIYLHLVSSLGSISSILDNLDRTVARELPQVSVLISELRMTLNTAEDVLTALTNNPLLRRGIPERVENQSGAANPRGVRF